MLHEKVMFLPRCNNPVTHISSSSKKKMRVVSKYENRFLSGILRQRFLKNWTHKPQAVGLIGNKSFLKPVLLKQMITKWKRFWNASDISCFLLCTFGSGESYVLHAVRPCKLVGMTIYDVHDVPFSLSLRLSKLCFQKTSRTVCTLEWFTSEFNRSRRH